MAKKKRARPQRLAGLHGGRVICAMSGGVDSSVAAALLKKQGYEVIGIFMKLWSDQDARTDLVKENICCSLEAAMAARAVANKLEIPFYVINLEKEFKKAVVDYYVKEYEAGRTPNPCVICNRDIKGEVLMRKVLEMKGDFLATGHYARIKKIENRKSKIEYQLLQSVDENKDQTYFLWMLKQNQLAKLLFPIGDYTKPDVRKMAADWKLPTAQRQESQGVCFIPDRDVCNFLRRHAKKLTQPGKVIDKTGKILGMHAGLVNYTIGQRERLGIGGPKAFYVVQLDSKKNVLVVSDEKDLYRKALIATEINWIGSVKRLNGYTVKSLKQINNLTNQQFNRLGGRIRYGHGIENCQIVFLKNKQIKVIFDEPQRAVTPGQSIVFYQGKEVLGGAVIEN